MSSVVEEPGRRSRGVKSLVIGLGVILGVTVIAVIEVNQTRPSRLAMGSYYKLVVAGNRQDIKTAKGLCSQRFLTSHGLELAPEGGLVGLPRGIDQNYKVWQEGENVWLCPTDRVGAIYQLIEENGVWKFDGMVGFLRPGNEVVVIPQAPVATGKAGEKEETPTAVPASE